MLFALAGCGTPAAEPPSEAAPTVDELPPAESESSAAEEPTEEPDTGEGVEVLDRAELSIADFSFRPRTVTIVVGGTVVWSQEDSAPHTVTSDDFIFDSGTMAEGGDFQFTFDTPGTFTYYCEIHPRMTGVIEVVEAAEAAGDFTIAALGGEDYYSD